MKVLFTPGPWVVSHGANLHPSVGSVQTHTKICDLPGDMVKGADESNAEIRANARLISECPNLLTSLATAYNLMNNGDRQNTIVAVSILKTLQRALGSEDILDENGRITIEF